MLINKERLMELGLNNHQSKQLIKQIKATLVAKGNDFYRSKKVQFVPIHEVEKVLGFTITNTDE